MRRWSQLGLTCAAALALLLAACGGDGDATPTPTPAIGGNAAMLAAITGALEAEHGWPPGSAEVTLDGVADGRFAHGNVRDPEGSGALWFAQLADGTWEIVWDGNGIVTCAALEPYGDFPASLLPQCSEPGGGLKTRS